jgi:hypothetical protein
MTQVNEREELPSILPENIIGCEIGVFEGDYSQVLVDSGKFKELYLVDVFSGVASSGNKRGKNIKTYNDASVLFEHNSDRFSKYDFVKVIKEDGISFLNRMTNKLDFVYIDTLHTYSQTIQELESAYLAVKSGGIIAGHDYNEEQYSGLVRAVKEFCLKYNLELRLTNQDTLESYYITKS